LLALMTLGQPLAGRAEPETTLNLQPGDELPVSIMELIPPQFHEQLVLLQFNQPLIMRMDLELPGLINRNDFDIPRTGLPTFYIIDTRNIAQGDIDWVKTNLPAPI